MPFIKYPHVIRLGQDDVEGYLNGTVYVTPKLDGTNSCLWYEDGKIHCGSRNRELSLDNDNAGFMNWIMSDSEDASILKSFCIEHPNVIVYGEWLGNPQSGKMLGTIKKYLSKGFYAFDIKTKTLEEDPDFHGGFVDPTSKLYIELQNRLGNHFLSPYAVLNNPSEQDVIEEVDKNHYNLPEDVIGEGIVIKNYQFLSKYGHHEFAKIVREEFKEDKARKKVLNAEDVEQAIVDSYITNADLEKCKQKVMTVCNMDERKLDGKAIGMFMTMLFKDLVEEEMYDIIKKMKKPTVNFYRLEKLVKDKAKIFLHL